MKIKKYWLFLIMILLILPYVIVLFTNSYYADASYDELYQLQAAKRLANDQGYTTHAFIPPSDLSSSEYAYLTRWPIGYSFILSLFLRAGFDLDLAAKILKIFILLFGLSLWLRLFDYIAKGTIINYIFILFICVVSIRYTNSPTDLIMWAIFPLFSLSMLAIKKCNDQEQNEVFKHIINASLLVSIMILTKYLGIVFLLCGTLWLLMIYRNNIVKMLIRLLPFCFFPLMVLGGILLTNKSQSGSTLWPAFFALLNNIHLNYRLYISEFSLALLYRLIPETFVIIISRLVGSVINNTLLLNSVSILFIIAIGRILFVLYKDRLTRNAVLWFLCALSSVIILFEVITFLFCFGRWDVPFTTSRYISFFGPFILMFLLIYFRQSRLLVALNEIINTNLSIAFISIILISSSIFYSVHLDQKCRHFTQQKEILSKEVNKILSSDPKAAIFTIASGWPYLLFNQRNFPVFSNINQVLNEQAYFTKPTWVIVACEKNTGWPDEYARTVSRYKFNKIEDAYAVLWWKKFKTGHLRDETGGRN